jgi:hypothetical protein
LGSDVVLAGARREEARGQGWPLGHPEGLALTPARSDADSTTTFEAQFVAVFSSSMGVVRTRCPLECL